MENHVEKPDKENITIYIQNNFNIYSLYFVFRRNDY